MTGSAVLLAAHGTRDPRGERDILDLVDRVQARTQCPVAVGFVELSRPRLADALTDLARQAGHVRVVPLLLGHAGHMGVDLPAAIAAARTTVPGVRIDLAPVLGPDERLTDALVEAAGAGRPAGPDEVEAVLVVGRGSSAPRTRA